MNHFPTTNNQSPLRLGFRKDINGLRAWAVGAVVLYHFGAPGFSGGFVGVDVFFVISGFLMTGIVVDGLERNGSDGFSLLTFYLARARRILPALIALCALLLALGWWLLLPSDYKMLGTHAAFSLAFVSNIKYWLEAGYFDLSSHEKLLLHTWSLAVEWQFYFLLPLLLLLGWRWRPGRRLVTLAMTCGLLISLIMCVLGTPLWPIGAFYLLPTRAWEMLAGGLVFLLANGRALSTGKLMILEIAGLVLIVGAVTGLDASLPWPGWKALMPVGGTVCVLVAARPESIWTSNAVAQWLGSRSYSLYLWHWPIIAILKRLDLHTDPRTAAAGLAVALALGHSSYHFVENPARRTIGRHSPAWGAAVLLCSVATMTAAGLEVRWNDGVAGRLSASVERIAKEGDNYDPRREECVLRTGTQSPSCQYGGEHLAAILIGDSHGAAVVTAIAAALPTPNDGLLNWTYVACPTARGVQFVSPLHPSRQCNGFLEWVFKKLTGIAHNVPIIIVNRTAVYAYGDDDGRIATTVPLVHFGQPYADTSPAFLEDFAQHLTDTACQLAADHPVYMLRPIPEMPVEVPKTVASAELFGLQRDVTISLRDYHKRHSFVWAAQDAARERCGVKILDPLPYLCWDGRCHGTKDGWPLYHDDDHLSEHGNKLLVPMFAQVFQKG